MGGTVPLGYRVENRALHVVESEAEFVRTLYRRYLELGSVRVKAALDTENVRSPFRMSRSGRTTGGYRLARSPLLDPVEPNLRRKATPQRAAPRRPSSGDRGR
jgi:hypothetical protein